MKKLLLSLSILAGLSTQAQNLFSENFDVFPTTWTQLNLSNPAGTGVWGQATAAIAPYFTGMGYNGGVTSFGFVNFNSTTGGTGTISNWLFTPVINVDNGDVISFYTIKGLSGGTTVYADNMEARLSLQGDFTADPVGVSGLGDYTTLMVAINPALTTTGYPTTWTQYSYTVTGLSGPTDVKVGFRYTVPNGGPTGANSDQIGLDQFSVDRTLATQQFFNQNFAVYPNPATDVLNISSKNGAIKAVAITDINGRTVKTINAGEVAAQINIADLNAGVYFVNASSDAGTGTTKIVKN